jgi:hypothetical protein
MISKKDYQTLTSSRTSFEMTTRDLNRLLHDKLTVEEFKTLLADEVDNYGRLMNQKGSTIDLRLYENEEITFDKLKFTKLLDLVITGQLSNIHLAYICDCLTLADKLRTDEKIKSLIFEIADPEINGGYLDKKTLTDMVSKIN